MKIVRKYGYLWILFLILGTVLCGSFLRGEPDRTRFVLGHGSDAREISVYDAGDGACFVFLPSYAELDEVTILTESEQPVILGGTQLHSGMSCGDFEFETPYAFCDADHRDSTLCFYRSGSVATIYIDTLSGSMDRVHADKNAEEAATVELYTADGAAACKSIQATVKGRGNTTWRYHKKPYLLELSDSTDLLGMGAATDWILLANAADGTNLYNKLIYDLAGQLDFLWTPQCEYVDVYLNGEYNGLYLLSEKVETGPDRLPIHTDGEAFLGEFGLFENRKDGYILETPRGRGAQVEYPEIVSEAEQKRMDALLGRMEAELLSGGDLAASEWVDLDSWARRYIIDELSGNVDADRASCFFYYYEGRFYAGPIWDYDKGLGNCQQSRNPCAFVANNSERSANYSLPYYPVLYSNPSFLNRVKELYKTEFLPLLNELINGGLELRASELSAASQMNALRWRGLTPDLDSAVLIPMDPEKLQEHLTRRVAFLNSAWIDNREYVTVQFELSPGAEYVNYAVERGEPLLGQTDLADGVWIDLGSGEVFRPQMPVEKDLILVRQETPAGAEPTRDAAGDNRGAMLPMLGAVCFFCMLVGLAIKDRRQNGPPGKGAGR